MGFLNLYAATERIAVSDDGAWWVEIRVSLPKSDYDAAQKALVPTAVVTREGQRAEMDVISYQLELVSRAIVNWNLTDENDLPLPVVPYAAARRSLQRLPQSVFMTIFDRVNELNSPRSQKDNDSFRNGAARRREARVDAESAVGPGMA
jgi:hypothetical protein